MFNTTLFSFLPNTAQIQFFTKLDWKIKKLTLCAAATVGTSSAAPRHLPVNKSNSAYIFSFFFEGTKSLSAILNLQPGIEIHMQLFRRIKPRPFFFFRLSGVERRCDGNFDILHFFHPMTRQQTSQKSILWCHWLKKVWKVKISTVSSYDGATESRGIKLKMVLA